MNLKQIAIILVGCSSLLMSAACSSKAPYWDEQSSQFHNPEEKFVISLPPNLDWEIADAKSMPTNVFFCGVAPDLSLCTFFVSEESNFNGLDIWKYPDDDIHNLIKRVTFQNRPGADVKYQEPVIEKCHYNSLKAVKFVTKIEIDEYIVKYIGYIFSIRNKLYSLVAMEPDSASRKAHELAIKSIEGLEFTK